MNNEEDIVVENTEAVKKTKKKINKLLIISIILLIVGLLGITIYFSMRYKDDKRIGELKDEIVKVDDSTSDEAGLRYYIIHGTIVQEQFKDIYLENEDFVGWIYNKGTKIDYPVTYTPDDGQYYLRRDFDGNYNIGGTIFLDENCDYLKPSDNMILYGHRMNDGSKFQSIVGYDSEEYYKKHKYIRFNTLTGNYTYEVFAAFKTSAPYSKDAYKPDYTGFNIYKEIYFTDKEHFNDFIQQCKDHTPYKTTDVIFGDELLTLSTCSYHLWNGRYVVVAKKVKETKVDLTKDPIEIID